MAKQKKSNVTPVKERGPAKSTREQKAQERPKGKSSKSGGKKGGRKGK